MIALCLAGFRSFVVPQAMAVNSAVICFTVRLQSNNGIACRTSLRKSNRVTSVASPGRNSDEAPCQT